MLFWHRTHSAGDDMGAFFDDQDVRVVHD